MRSPNQVDAALWQLENRVAGLKEAICCVDSILTAIHERLRALEMLTQPLQPNVLPASVFRCDPTEVVLPLEAIEAIKKIMAEKEKR